MIDNLILGPGGLKGYALIGSLKALEKYNLLKNIKTIIGVSIGSIIGFLYCLGYSCSEMEYIFNNFNINKYHNLNEENIINYLNNYGIIDSKTSIEKLVKIFIKNKNLSENITFNDLYKINNIEFVIVGSNITLNKTEYFNYKKYPNMKILTAINISSCIPLYIIPIKYNNNLYVDGGFLNNYPIEYINKKKYNKTLAIIFSNSNNNNTNNFNNFMSHLFNNCFMKEINKLIYNIILNPPITALDFNSANKIKQECFDYGYNVTLKYIADNFLDII